MKIPLHIILSASSALLPFFTGLVFLKHLSKELKFIWFFFVYSVLHETTLALLAINKINNLWLGDIYTLLELSFWILFFSFLEGHKVRKILIRLTILFWFLLWILIALLGKNLFEVNNITRTVEGLFILIIGFYTLYKLDKKELSLFFISPHFWLISGALIYFSGTIIIFSLANIILNNHQEIWMLHSIYNITMHLCCAYGFVCVKLGSIYNEKLTIENPTTIVNK
jgi:hypothetical protein